MKTGVSINSENEISPYYHEYKILYKFHVEILMMSFQVKPRTLSACWRFPDTRLNSAFAIGLLTRRVYFWDTIRTQTRQEFKCSFFRSIKDARNNDKTRAASAWRVSLGSFIREIK